MFKLGQILFVLFFAAGIMAYYGKKKQRKVGVPFCLVALLVISAFCSNAILQNIPLPTEKVVVTATGEKDPKATTNEVWVKGYLVGGKEYPQKNPSEGKWFWQGNVYMWRDELDFRQPKGTTRSITLDIPYGRDRAVQFYANEWGGMVEVSYNGVSQRYNLFPTHGETLVNAWIEDTEAGPLYATKIFRLCVFGAITLLFMAYPCYAAYRFDDEKWKSFYSGKWSRLVYILLAVCCFAVMFFNGKNTSFWADEIYTLGWTYLGNPNKFVVGQWLNDLWFFLMPYGQEYLLILPELLVAISVYVAGRVGELYKGKRFGVIMAALLASSLPAMVQGGSEFRPYALLIFATFGLLYFYIKKQREQNKRKSTLVIYMLLLFLTMNAHPFGFVLTGLMMLSDFILIISKRVKPTVLLEFVVPCLYAVYWLLFQLKNTGMSSYGNGWAPKPSLRGAVSNFQWLCNSNNLTFALLLIGIAVTVVYLADRHRWKNAAFWENYTLLTLLWVPVTITALTFLYSWIFKGASLFITRYFVAVLANVIFLIAIAIDGIIEIMCQGVQGTNERVSLICVLSCVLILCSLNWKTVPTVYAYGGEDYRGSAEYLMSQGDIYNSSTICLVYGNQYQNAGFDYDLTQKGKRDPIEHRYRMPWEKIPDDIFEYDTIYCVYHHTNVCDEELFLENGYVEVTSDSSLAIKKYIKS